MTSTESENNIFRLSLGYERIKISFICSLDEYKICLFFELQKIISPWQQWKTNWKFIFCYRIIRNDECFLISTKRVIIVYSEDHPI